MTEAEARTLLLHPLMCLDCGEWIASKDQPETLRISAGLTDQHGRPTHLSVELRHRKVNRPRLRTFVFTVLMHNVYGTHRVYQLDVHQSGRQIKDAHKRPHEHCGGRRRVGPATWGIWRYDEVLRHFCGQTNIDFRPAPSDPEQFQGSSKQ